MPTKKKKPTHGGKRAGAGAPKKEPTKTLSYRVPLKDADMINQHIRALIAQIKNSL